MKKYLFLSVIVGLIGLAVEPISGQQASIDKILERAVAAVGTASELESIETLSVFAECRGPDGRYTTRVVSGRGERVYFEQRFAYKPLVKRVTIINGVGWDSALPNDGRNILTRMDRSIIRNHEFQKIAFDFKNYFSDFRSLDDDGDAKSPVVRIAAKASMGENAVLYFDKASGLLSGFDLLSGDGPPMVEIRYHKWDRTSGINLPVAVTAKMSEGFWRLDYKSIEINKKPVFNFTVPDRIADVAELMRLHGVARASHLNYDAEQFVGLFAEKLTQIQAGDVLVRDKPTNLARFRNYFSSFKFKSWDNIVPPVILISDDGSMATVQVQKNVSGDYTDEEGKVHFSETIFAWLEVWRKIDGAWKVVTVASTRKSK